MSGAQGPAPPAARPVPADAVIESGASGAWARGLLTVLGAWLLTALVWWVTGSDALYAAVVATTALGILGGGPITLRRGTRALGSAAALALVGGLALAATDMGPAPGRRLLLGAVGVLGAALVLVVTSLIRRGSARS